MTRRLKIGLALSILWAVMVTAVSVAEHLDYKEFEARVARCPAIRTAGDLASCDLSYVDGAGPISATRTLVWVFYPLATGWLLAFLVAGIAERVASPSRRGT